MEFITKEDFVEKLDSGQYEIWCLAKDCWMLCEFVETVHGKTLDMLTVVGSKDKWSKMLDSIERIAAENGAKFIYGVGFAGWKKFMEKRGYKTRALLRMTKEL